MKKIKFGGFALICILILFSLSVAVSGYAFNDLTPPAGWAQCAGFVNTPIDDIDSNFMIDCLNRVALRVRVWTSADVLEEDVYSPVEVLSAWPNWRNISTGLMSKPTSTYWGSSDFFVSTSGSDICDFKGAPTGLVFGGGSAGSPVIVADNAGYGEYRINCNGVTLNDRKIAIYYLEIQPSKQEYCEAGSCLKNTWTKVSNLNDIKNEKGIRVIVKAGGVVEDDFYAVGITRYPNGWPSVAPLGGIVQARKLTNMIIKNTSTLTITTSDPCLQSSEPFSYVIVTGALGQNSIRPSCSGPPLSRTVEIYMLKASESTSNGRCTAACSAGQECLFKYIGDTCYQIVTIPVGTESVQMPVQGNCTSECNCRTEPPLCIGGPASSRECCEYNGFEWLPSGESEGSADTPGTALIPHSQFGSTLMLPPNRYVCTSDYPPSTPSLPTPYYKNTRLCDESVCLNSLSDVALCDKTTDCVYNGKCYSDIKAVAATFFSSITNAAQSNWWAEVSADTNLDRAKEVCDPGQWTNFYGVLEGTVTNTGGVVVSGAIVTIVGESAFSMTTTTAGDGTYTLPDIPVGTYDIYVTAPGYQPASQVGKYIQFSQNSLDFTIANFVLVPGSVTCNNDCTLKGTVLCSAGCHGQGGCLFYDENVKVICDGQPSGFVKEYSSGLDVVCCDGVPYPKMNILANFQVDAKHVARVVKAVQLPDGRLGKMIVYAFK
ncbi:MAG: carboxypeptidase-like regulatory domain-containing protein [Candidatus Woesearchaeota archaeon]